MQEKREVCAEDRSTKYPVLVPHSIHAVGATAEGKSIFAYDKGGKVAAAYEQFAKEVAEIGEKQKNRNRADRIR